MKDLIANMVRLEHPRREEELCLFTDASDKHWGVVLTQVAKSELGKPVDEQDHRPLCFLSGSFTKSQMNWSTIEKEAYPIIVALGRLKHFLDRPEGFRLFTDHRNLVYIFNPTTERKSTTDRLARWSSLLCGFKYVLEHIAGVVWADLLSRWRIPVVQMAMMAVHSPGWPNIQVLLDAQEKFKDEIPKNLDEFSPNQPLSKGGRIWIPPIQELRTRIMLIGMQVRVDTRLWMQLWITSLNSAGGLGWSRMSRSSSSCVYIAVSTFSL
jgi:hypothetical protein